MEVVGRYSGPIITDIHDGRFLTGSYVAHWFQPVGIPEIYGARDLCLDPNNIEYYCVSEEERQRRLDGERLIREYTISDTISFDTIDVEQGTVQVEPTEFTVGPPYTHDYDYDQRSSN